MQAPTRKKIWTIAISAFLAVAASATLLSGIGEGDAVAADAELPDAVIAMNQLVGKEPERCVFAGPDRELCSWRLQGHLFQGAPGETTEKLRDITLVCELSLSGETDQPTCRSHTSERLAAADLPPVAAGLAGEEPSARPLLEGEGLTRARNIIELSHLAGDIPARCVTGVGAQLCTWQLLPGSGGHARIAAGRRGSVWLRCQLPLDGSDRAPGSCSASAMVLEAGAS